MNSFVDLKKLVLELEQLLIDQQRGSTLDALARDQFQARINALKKEIDQMEAGSQCRLTADALNLAATLLSIFTNVMTLIK